MMLSLSFGPVTLAYDHLVLLVALAMASLIGGGLARRGRVDTRPIVFNLMLLGLACARMGFVIAYWPSYQADPWQALDVRDGGFLALPGVLGLVLAALLFGWRRPQARRPLAWSLLGAAVVWAAGGLLGHWHEQQTRLPELTLHDAQQRPVTLQHYAGRPLVVNLWASWCPPCRREIPVLQEAQHAYPGVTFLFVNQGETPELLGTFLATAGLTGSRVLFDEAGELARRVGSGALPTTLFYDADGRLVGSHLGELSRASLRHALLPLLQSTPSAPDSTGH
ncbi:MAG: putative thiol:disulfide interchange protein dsbE [Pseudomonas sp.]|jgi:thiol-disulfide isomerase/thioredoxin|nr:putative thiol:disulfide interchange protein dsbE [Pseudomonas sp.]